MKFLRPLEDDGGKDFFNVFVLHQVRFCCCYAFVLFFCGFGCTDNVMASAHTSSATGNYKCPGRRALEDRISVEIHDTRVYYLLSSSVCGKRESASQQGPIKIGELRDGSGKSISAR